MCTHSIYRRAVGTGHSQIPPFSGQCRLHCEMILQFLPESHSQCQPQHHIHAENWTRSWPVVPLSLVCWRGWWAFSLSLDGTTGAGAFMPFYKLCLRAEKWNSRCYNRRHNLENASSWSFKPHCLYSQQMQQGSLGSHTWGTRGPAHALTCLPKRQDHTATLE